MDIQEFFYIVASIALVLISITIVALFYLIIRLKQAVDIFARQSKMLAQTWSGLTLTRIFLRFLKLIF